MKNHDQGMKLALQLSSITLFATIGLSACSPVKEYRRPDPQLPAAYPGQAEAGKEMAAVP